MENIHRKLIEKNFSALVALTNLTQLIPLLLEAGVFSSKMAERFLDNQVDDHDRKTQLYFDIQRRGPKAFECLVSSLSESGHWDLVRLLQPDHHLNGMNYISIKEKRSESRNNSNQRQAQNLPISENLLDTFDQSTKPVVVLKANTFGISPVKELMCYPMKSRNRGVFFMINNIFEDTIKYRQGAHYDEKNLREMFLQIGFHKIIVHIELTAKVMEEKLLELSKSEDLKQTESLFIVIGSHGTEQSGENYIEGVDDKMLAINTVISMFNSTNCKYLHNIPKVFIFQLCRGSNTDYGSIPASDGVPDKPNIPEYSDMVIAHSTLPRHKSFRDVVSGSWYIQTFCNVVQNHAHDTHLEDLFKMISNRMKVLGIEKYLQTPTVEYRGFGKHCFLNPGLFE